MEKQRRDPTYSLTKRFPSLLRREAHLRQHRDLFGTWFRTAAAAATACSLDDRSVDIYQKSIKHE